MKIKYGDLFTTDEQVIGHGVNTKGVMGAGVAAIVRDKFPETYRAYKYDCMWGLLVPGEAAPGPHENGKVIMNIASQMNPGPNATYTLLERSMVFAVGLLRSAGIKSMAIPQIGCGIGGLEWDSVKSILDYIEDKYDFEFEVWIYA